MTKVEEEKLHRTMSAWGFQLHQGPRCPKVLYTYLSASAFYIYGDVSIWFTGIILPTQAICLFIEFQDTERDFWMEETIQLKGNAYIWKSDFSSPHKGHLNAWNLWIYLLCAVFHFQKKELSNLYIYRKAQKVENGLTTLWTHYGCLQFVV